MEQKTLLRLAAPVVVSFWMRAGFTLVDTAYASTLGDAAVAAIGLTVPLEFLMIACWIGTSTGLTSSLSRAMGAQQGEKIDQLIRVTRRIIIALCALFLLLGIGVWFATPKLGLNAEVTDNLQIYATVILLGSALGSFWSILPDSVVKAHQDTRSTMWAGIWSNLVNLALNTLFLFYLRWGIFGIAFSTVLGRYAGLAYAIRQARRHERERIGRGTDLVRGLSPHPVREILTLAIPAALAYGLMALEGTALNALIALQPQATEGIAAYAVFHRAFLFLAMPLVAVTIAMLPFVAHLHGRGSLPEIRQGLREAYLAGSAYTLLFVLPVCVLCGDWLAGKLSDNQTTRMLIQGSLMICPVLCIASMPFILCRPVFEGLGAGRPVALLATLRYLVLTLPACYGGLTIAERLGHPPLYGLLAGLVFATTVVSGISQLLLHRALRTG